MENPFSKPKLKPTSVQVGKPEEKKTYDSQAVLNKVKTMHRLLFSEMEKVIVGQHDVIELVIIALFCRGHVLLEGVPGLGKTLMFRTLSKAMALRFQHVQFTPDLMPADIIGTEIIQTDTQTGKRDLRFIPGPIFCHFLLADEINRTSPKTQAALLQGMQDREVTVGKKTYRLEAPFFVLATQNPIDQEGVYPLPEAQVDRFMFNIFIDYPEADEEVEIARRHTQPNTAEIERVISHEDILEMQDMVKGMLISDDLLHYAVNIVTATRPGNNNSYRFVNEWVEFGAGPRATLNIVMAAKARALLKGRYCVASEDIRAIAPSILRHRLKLNFAANAENIQTDDVIKQILEAVPDRRK